MSQQDLSPSPSPLSPLSPILTKNNVTTTTTAPTKNNRQTLLLSLSLLTILTSIKILLIPSYRSTDFDVHRNWLSITKHLPLSQWYYDDLDGKTVHTLDYPPLFAFFEYILSHNPILDFVIKKNWLDEQCLGLLGDEENDVSLACVVYQRCTVIVSDVIFIWGSYFASRAVLTSNNGGGSNNNNFATEKKVWITTVLLVFNPGVLMLDHVHFQYNGMLLGWLLLSIGCIVRGVSSTTSNGFISYEIIGAALYASLLCMKHLYLTLAPLYLVYLFRRVCFEEYTINSTSSDGNKPKLRFAMGKFTILAIVTLFFFVTPFIPFLLQPPSALDQLSQILRRLFPFGRGLVHDYWAANVWALYSFADKCLTFLFRKIAVLGNIIPRSIVPLPIISPAVSAICLLLGMIPALVCAWRVAANSTSLSSIKKTDTKEMTGKIFVDEQNQRTFFVRAVVFCSFTGFMFSYHCHEKAIMTSVIPLTLIATTSREDASLYLRTSTLGHFGLLPLLFRPAESMFKVVVYVMFLSLSVLLLEHCVMDKEMNEESDNEMTRGSKQNSNYASSAQIPDETAVKGSSGLLTLLDRVGLVVLAILLIYMEIIHPLFLRPKNAMEFLPLMATSVICALGLVDCWMKSLMLMMRYSQPFSFVDGNENGSKKKKD